MTNHEILRAAAVEVRKGWNQGRFENEDGSQVCAVGALGRVWRRHEWPSAMFDENDRAEALIYALARHLPGGSQPLETWVAWNLVVDWNNTPGRTAEQVAEAMELAALYAEQEAKGARPELVGV